MMDVCEVDWIEGGSFEFSPTDAKAYIDMIQEHGVTYGEYDLNDIYVFYDAEKAAFIIQASE